MEPVTPENIEWFKAAVLGPLGGFVFSLVVNVVQYVNAKKRSELLDAILKKSLGL